MVKIALHMQGFPENSSDALTFQDFSVIYMYMYITHRKITSELHHSSLSKMAEGLFAGMFAYGLSALASSHLTPR